MRQISGMLTRLVVGVMCAWFVTQGGPAVRSAGAQSLYFNCGDPLILCGGGAPVHAQTGDADLDRAVALCDARTHYNGIIDGAWRDSSIDPEFKAACGPVLSAWQKTKTAQDIAERAAKASADKAWLEDYAKRLKP